MKEMKRFALLFLCLLAINATFAGNKNRIGQAGAQELLLNPWGRSSGMAGANMANSVGLESIFLNVSGLAFIDKTELSFTRTDYLSGSGMNINAFGLGQRVGESAVIGAYVKSVGFGDIDRTTIENPDGGLGTFSPQFLTLNISYARAFSNSIYGGFTLKTISETINDAKANGVAIDMGIRYVTGARENLKFGIALKNVGPKMNFNGDGFSTKVLIDGKEMTINQRRQAFEMPSTLSLGASYDLFFDNTVGGSDSSAGKALNHRVTISGNFVSNSFGKDMIMVGAEYAFNEMFMVRGGYRYEEGVLDVETREVAFTGPTAGASVALPLGKGSDNTIAIDYSYTFSNPFNGSHAYGIRLNF